MSKPTWSKAVWAFDHVGFFRFRLLSRPGRRSMQMRLLFWILMLFWLVFGVWSFWPAGGAAPLYGAMGWDLVLFLLVGLLGWKVFGAPLQA
jgi:hypothetical protein